AALMATSISVVCINQRKCKGQSRSFSTIRHPRWERSMRHPPSELQFGEAGIDTALLDEGLMRPLFDDAAMVEYEDAVGLEHGRKPMSDDKCRAVSHQAVQSLLHQHFALGIERRCRLVKQKDGRG